MITKNSKDQMWWSLKVHKSECDDYVEYKTLKLMIKEN